MGGTQNIYEKRGKSQKQPLFAIKILRKRAKNFRGPAERDKQFLIKKFNKFLSIVSMKFELFQKN